MNGTGWYSEFCEDKRPFICQSIPEGIFHNQIATSYMYFNDFRSVTYGKKINLVRYEFFLVLSFLSF